MRSKNNELRKVKALAQVILDQRSDVEQFFLEALEQIKEEIRKKISAERKQRRLNGIPQNLPTSNFDQNSVNNVANSQASSGGGGLNDPNQQNKSYTDKVDLNDLDWEDRERVLRLLFSKMSAGVPANVQHIQQQINNARQARAMNNHGASQVSNEQLVAALDGSFLPPAAIEYHPE